MTRVTKTIYFNGLIVYFKKGTNQFHRLDGPAVIWPHGSRYWYQNGLRHRTDGPAIEHSNGYKEYWIDGIPLSEQGFKDRVKK